MLDIKLIREAPKLIKENQKKRGLDSENIDKLLEFDKYWRELKQQNDNLRASRNKISEKINEAKKRKDDKLAKELIEEAKGIPEKYKKTKKNF